MNTPIFLPLQPEPEPVTSGPTIVFVIVEIEYMLVNQATTIFIP